MSRPAATTRPLYWLAQERGKDYTDVLNVAWGIKQLLTGQEPGVHYKPAVARIYEDEVQDGSEGTTYALIFQHVSDFVAQQATASRPPREDFDPIFDGPPEPGFVHEGP